jgi:hypothetical protein
MSTINGTGTKYYGWQPVRSVAGRTAYATYWFVLFYAPIMPLRRHKLKVLTDRANEGFFGGAQDEYQILEETPLDWTEVLGTWWAFLRGLLVIVVPFLVFLAISNYQNAQRAQGQPLNRLLGLVAVVGLVWSLVTAVVIPLRAWRRSRG